MVLKRRSYHTIGITVISAVRVGSCNASDFGTSSPKIIDSAVANADQRKMDIDKLIVADVQIDKAGVDRICYASSVAAYVYCPTVTSTVDFVIVAIGVFALGEVLGNMESREGGQMLPVPKGLRNLLPTKQDLKDSRFAFANGSLVGFFIGVLPGAGADMAAWVSYAMSKRFSKEPEKFGTGHVEGLVEAGASNNASIASGWVPSSGTPAASSPAASLSGVWPPNWTTTPSGRSTSTIPSTSSSVSGSKYSRSDVS